MLGCDTSWAFDVRAANIKLEKVSVFFIICLLYVD